MSLTSQPLHRPRCTRESEWAENSTWRRVWTGANSREILRHLETGADGVQAECSGYHGRNSEDTFKRDFKEKIGYKTRLCFLRKHMKKRVSHLPHRFALRQKCRIQAPPCTYYIRIYM